MKVQLECKIQDCWIGVYWRREEEQLHIWICLLPCFPLHIQVHPKELVKPDAHAERSV